MNMEFDKNFIKMMEHNLKILYKFIMNNKFMKISLIVIFATLVFYCGVEIGSSLAAAFKN